MKVSELTSALVEVHNMIARVTVNGDNAILVGDALRAMRRIVRVLHDDGIESDSGVNDVNQKESEGDG